MASESPVFLVQNPALGSLLLWEFCRGFQAERPDAQPLLPSLFCVLPIVFHGPTLQALKSTNMPSGLGKFASKLGEEREALFALHDRAIALRELTFASVATAITTRLLRLDYSTAEIWANEERIPLVPERLKHHHAGAQKLGHWFARLPLSHAMSALRIEA